MKRTIKRMILLLLLLVVFSVLLLTFITGYLFLAEITSNPTTEVEESVAMEIKIYENRKIFILTPKTGVRNEKVIFYLHGGSYMAEASAAHWAFLIDLVEDTGSKVIMPDYPLTPKYNYQDVFAMIVPVYEKIAQEENRENIIIMGDSAGGGMALALCQKVGEEQQKKPSQLILLSPWLDVRMENEEIKAVEEKDKQLNKEALKIAGVAYAGKDGMESYLVNPILRTSRCIKRYFYYDIYRYF